jgi:hypothetical protein
MGNKRRVVVRNAGAFLGSSGLGPLPAPMNALYDGPGKAGPGDDWHIPPESDSEVTDQDDVIIEPVRAARPEFVPLNQTRQQ